MANTPTDSIEPGASGRPEPLFTWIVTILACAYLGWTGFSLYRSTAAFCDLYSSIGADLPWPTWFVIHYYQWLYPSLFGGASAGLITKQFCVRKMWLSLGLTIAAAFVFGVVLSAGIVRALYLPVTSDSLQKSLQK